VAEAERDCAAYETLLSELQQEEATALPAEEFAQEMQQVRCARALCHVHPVDACC
jgi:hypothetical protein